MTDLTPATAAFRCLLCGRPRAECRTPDNPFLSCCLTCSANDGDTHREPSVVTVRKVAGSIPISRETAMDYGLIPDDRPPYVPTRRERFRWWRQERLRRARMRLASWIAGFDVEDRW